MVTVAWRILSIQGHPVLLCLLCDRYSANVHDIEERYCGYCHRYLTEVLRDYVRPADRAPVSPLPRP